MDSNDAPYNRLKFHVYIRNRLHAGTLKTWQIGVSVLPVQLDGPPGCVTYTCTTNPLTPPGTNVSDSPHESFVLASWSARAPWLYRTLLVTVLKKHSEWGYRRSHHNGWHIFDKLLVREVPNATVGTQIEIILRNQLYSHVYSCITNHTLE